MALGVAALLFIPTVFLQAADMQERIQTGIEILDKKQHSSDPIPESLLNHAKGVAIFTLTKAGLGIGGKGGDGIILVRLGGMKNSWTAPSAFNLEGASLGTQIGFTEDRYIVILNTDVAVNHFTSAEKMTWNATVSGTAGSTTETEKISTTELEHRDIVVYKESSGLFAGATFGGTTIGSEKTINRQAYGDDVRMKNILNGNVDAPKSADRLYLLLNGKA